MCFLRLSFFVLVFQYVGYAQTYSKQEKLPTFPSCKDLELEQQQLCFAKELQRAIYKAFVMPKSFSHKENKAEIPVLFKVDTLGIFKTIYIGSADQSLKNEVIRVFSKLPKITPALYNGRKIPKQYSTTIKIPLVDPDHIVSKVSLEKQEGANFNLEGRVKTEIDRVKEQQQPFENKRYKSQLNIPFIHAEYGRFDRALNIIGANTHTASKPFLYADVSDYYDFNKVHQSVIKPEAKTWFGRKLWNEHMLQIQEKDYWFTLDPIVDLQLGKDTDASFDTTYNNTRGFLIQGGLGEKFNFYSTFFESQGRFANYVNTYAESLKAFGPDPAIIPGRGIAKRFKTDAYDYPVAEAYMSYTPIKLLNIQFGHGKNFIGDGYRSLFLSDIASPSPFFKLNTKFWKIKYTNTWLWLKDVRPEVVEDKAFLTKYMANHYLSWNVTKRFNLGLFESVIWTNSNNRGFDINYLNPIIFYRAIEFETGQGAGNALLGASAKYKITDNVNIYGQFILDEFSLQDIKSQQKSWKNKYGYQIGGKYYNAFEISNLIFQLEYNRVRPYVYSHNTIVLNYGHNNQSVAHLWGSNFSEAIFLAQYRYKRWFASTRFIYGIRGFDFNDGVDNFNYGGDIYRNENDRPFDTGVVIGQGIKAKTFYGNLKMEYLINPSTNLKCFTEVTLRNFKPDQTTVSLSSSNTFWFNIGVRTDLFNWYFDF